MEKKDGPPVKKKENMRTGPEEIILEAWNRLA